MELDLINGTPTSPNFMMTPEESECVRNIQRQFEEDDELKSLSELAKDHLVVMLVRAYDCNTQAVMRVLKSIHMYATKTYPELFRKVDPVYLKHVIDMKIFDVVQQASETGPGVICARIKRWKPNKASPDDLLAAGVLYVYQIAKESVHVQRNGLVCIVDIEGFGFNHAKHCTYDLATKVMHCITYCAPVKLLGYIAINSHPLFEKLYHIMKFVLPEKARKNIYITKKDYTPIHQFVSLDSLPVSLGGNIPEDIAWVTGIEDKIYKDEEMHKIITEVQEAFPHLMKSH